MLEYHTSSGVICAYSLVCSWYDSTQAIATSFAFVVLILLCIAAITKLAAKRFTSHSHGAGNVSSKSLISKTIRLSGVAKLPKFTRWQSPQDCTLTPVEGVLARSAAIIAAPPR